MKKKLDLKKIKPKKKLVVKEKKVKVKKDKKPKKEKIKTKKKKNIGKKIWYTLLIAFVSLCIIGILGVIAFFIYIMNTAPEFDQALLYEKESTLIYASTGELIATLGVKTEDIVEKREKLTYDEIPEVLIDAIIATEDSRFFQHNGFDFPRFLKASIGQVLGNSDAGGASTLTMQVSKNTYTSLDSSGIKGIIRKFTDIYMSIFKIEKHYTKEDIFEFYVNAPFLGNGSYGIEQASQNYFGKSAKNLSLAEAALIAGLFQAPTSYDPTIYPENATARRDNVLYLMERHGYITKDQRKAAEAISVESLLVDQSANVNEFQGFIDTVIEEAREVTGNDPYAVPMIIYTTLDIPKQRVVNSVYDGSAGFYFKDDVIQFATTAIDNNTGAIYAVGAGRHKSGEMSQNYATQINRHPGSTAKPLFDYGPGFEYEKWSTYTPFFDEKDTTYSSGGVMYNWNSSNAGFSTLRRCLVDSVNTCALQAFQRLDKAQVYEFVTNLNIQPESNEYGTIYESHSIGAFNGVSPLQLAAAYAAFGNGGYYVKPYSISKIEYRESDEIYEHEVVKKKAMSPQTAYLVSNVLLGVTPWTVRVSGTQVATKTGTSSYDNDTLASLGLSRQLIQDSWVATYSPDITITLWLGYDELTVENNIYMSEATTARTTIQGILCNGIMPAGSSFTNPGGIVSSQVEIGTIPAMLPSEYTPTELIQSHLFISGTEPTEKSFRYSQLSDPTNLKYSLDDDTLKINWTSPGTPAAIDFSYLTTYFQNSFDKWAGKYLEERITYNNNYIGTFGFEIYLSKNGNETYVGFTDKTSYEIDVSDYPGYDTVIVRSAYTIFKANKSNGISKKYSSVSYSPTELDISLPTIKLNVGESWKGSSESDIQVSLDGTAITGFNATITMDTITNTNGDSISLNNLTEASDTYTITYTVSLEYLGVTYDSKKITQKVIVSDDSSSSSE